MGKLAEQLHGTCEGARANCVATKERHVCSVDYRDVISCGWNTGSRGAASSIPIKALVAADLSSASGLIHLNANFARTAEIRIGYASITWDGTTGSDRNIASLASTGFKRANVIKGICSPTECGLPRKAPTCRW